MWRCQVLERAITPGPGDYELPSTLNVSGGSWFGMRSALQAVLEPESHYSFPFMSQHTAGGETHPSQRSSASWKLAGMRQVRVRILSSQRSIPMVAPGAFTRPRATSSGRKSAQRRSLDLESTMCALEVGSPTRCTTTPMFALSLSDRQQSPTQYNVAEYGFGMKFSEANPKSSLQRHIDEKRNMPVRVQELTCLSGSE